LNPGPPKPQRVDDSGLDDDVWTLRATYVIGFAAIGLVIGAIAVGIRSVAVSPTMTLFAACAGGGIVGLELHATRDWSSRGELAKLGRWSLAFVSAAALVGSAWRVFGAISLREFYLLLLGAAVAGPALYLYFTVDRSHLPWPFNSG
jgi:hypothetical protein